MKRNRGLLALIIILVIIFIDQATKLYVKTHFYLGESVDVTSWFKILFIALSMYASMLYALTITLNLFFIL